MTAGTGWRWLGGAAVAAVAVGLVVLALGPGSRPARLAAVEPADGSVLGRPPAQIVLTFTAAPNEVHVGVTRADGAPVGDVAQRSGSVVRIPVHIDAVGAYAVGYHVVFDDGRELSGQTRFSVGSRAVSVAGPIGDPDAGAADDPAGHPHGGTDPMSLLATGVGVLGALVVMTVLLRRPRAR